MCRSSRSRISSRKRNGGRWGISVRMSSVRWLTLQPSVHRQHRPRDIAGLAGGQEQHAGRDLVGRSEEHTSELQSLAYLVCRLLLEKKKTLTYAPNLTQHTNGPDNIRTLCMLHIMLVNID